MSQHEVGIEDLRRVGADVDGTLKAFGRRGLAEFLRQVAARIEREGED